MAISIKPDPSSKPNKWSVFIEFNDDVERRKALGDYQRRVCFVAALAAIVTITSSPWAEAWAFIKWLMY